MAVRQDRRQPRADRCAAPVMLIAAHRDQARQPRAGAVQAEALRLQQRADRGLQVPLDVRRSMRRHRVEAVHQGRSARHPRRPLHPQDLASTNCRSSSTWCSRATSRWSARGRTRCTPRPRTGSTTRRSTAISRAIASSPASPAGRRSTAGAARPTPHEKIQRRVEHDLYYIENWSVLFDLYILAMTPFALLKTENAY